MWRSRLLGKFLGLAALVGLVGMAGLWWLNHWSLERRLRDSLLSQISVQADLAAAHVKGHYRLLELHRQREGLTVRRELEVLAKSYLELCQSAHRRQEKGLFSIEQAQEAVRQALLGQRVGLSGYPFVLDIRRAPQSIVLAVHPKIQGTDVAYVDFVRQAAQMKRGYMEYRWANPGEEDVRDKVGAMEYFEPWQWVICVSAYRGEFQLMVNQDFYHDAQRQLETYLQGLRPGPGGQALVLDEEGRLPWGTPGPATPSLEPELILAAMSQERGVVRLPGPAGPRVAAFRNLPPLGRLLLITPEDEALARSCPAWTAGMSPAWPPGCCCGWRFWGYSWPAW
jgi:hypothetical protein